MQQFIAKNVTDFNGYVCSWGSSDEHEGCGSWYLKNSLG